MSVERVEWKCPGCGKRYAIPAQRPEPKLCPACRNHADATVKSNPFDIAEAQQPQETLDFHIDTSPSEAEVVPVVEERAPVFTPATQVGLLKKYPALRTISLCYKILAIVVAVVAVVGMLLSIKNVVLAEASTERTIQILIGLAIFGGGAFGTISLFAMGELIQVQLDIEENTRKASLSNSNEE